MKASITLFFIMLLCVGCHNSGNSTKVLLAHIDSLTAKVEIAKADSLFATITPKALKDDDDKAHYIIIKAKLDMVLNRQLDNDSAFNFCIRHYESTGNQKDLAQSYYIKGAAKAMAGNLKEALPLIKKAEIIERKAGVPELRYIIYANISYVYSELGAKHTALDYARKALAVADETGDIDNLCFAYNNIASDFYDLGMKDSAYIYISKIKPHLDEVMLDGEKAGYMGNIGAMYSELGLHGKAEAILEQADSILPDQHIKMNLARTYYEMGKDRKADSLVKAVWPTTCYDLKAEMLQFLAERAEKNGDFKISTNYYRQAKAMRDSDNLAKNAEDAMAVQHEIEREEYEKNVERKNLLSAIIGLFIVILLVSIGLIYHKRTMKRAKNIIAESNKQITGYSEKIIELEKADRQHSHEAEVLRHKIRKLKDEQNALLARGQALYDSVKAGGTTATWKKKEFDEFVEFYRVSHPDTVADAENNYKRLSPTNIFYLILVDMGFSDTDAQRIMCMNPGALRTMKSRINGKKNS